MRNLAKKLLIGTAACVVLLLCTGWAYVASLDLASQPVADPATRPQDLPMMQRAMPATRGRILAVLTSTPRVGDSRYGAGYELTELSRAYYTFLANGYEVEMASPLGGRPPGKLDDELVEADHAFLNDPVARALVANTIPLDRVDPTRYAAVYFVGGKGAMFDFPRNPDVQRLIAAVYDGGGVIGAVCHGPAALLDVTLGDGSRLLDGRRVTGFTNEEELFLIEDARDVFPFLLEETLAAQAGEFSEGAMYLDHVVVDGRLVTGQNPWSTWTVAESMIRALGHEPVSREPTREENSVRVLAAYHRGGEAAAEAALRDHAEADKRLLLMHAVIAGMQGRIGEAFELQRLAHF